MLIGTTWHYIAKPCSWIKQMTEVPLIGSERNRVQWTLYPPVLEAPFRNTFGCLFVFETGSFKWGFFQSSFYVVEYWFRSTSFIRLKKINEFCDIFLSVTFLAFYWIRITQEPKFWKNRIKKMSKQVLLLLNLSTALWQFQLLRLEHC